jgi:hypothetical protein
VVGPEPKGANCSEGGSNFEQEGSGIKKFACNGTTGFTKTLPPGETETGSFWLVGSPAAGLQVSPLSFAIPLSVADAASIEVHFWREEVGKEDPECTGTPNAPEAEPGTICIYFSNETNIGNDPLAYKPDLENPGIGTNGTLLYRENATADQYMVGGYAVTAPL